MQIRRTTSILSLIFLAILAFAPFAYANPISPTLSWTPDPNPVAGSVDTGTASVAVDTADCTSGSTYSGSVVVTAPSGPSPAPITIPSTPCGTSNTIHFTTTVCGIYKAEFSGTTTSGGSWDLVDHPTVECITTTNTTPILAGGTATDSATLVGTKFPSNTATGTITFNVYNGGTCAGAATPAGTAVVTGDNTYPGGSHVFAVAGTYSWNAVYSGDSANPTVTSPCELQIVNPVTHGAPEFPAGILLLMGAMLPALLLLRKRMGASLASM